MGPILPCFVAFLRELPESGRDLVHEPSVREFSKFLLIASTSLWKILQTKSFVNKSLFKNISEIYAHNLGKSDHSLQICDLGNILAIYPHKLWLSFVF